MLAWKPPVPQGEAKRTIYWEDLAEFLYNADFSVSVPQGEAKRSSKSSSY